MVLIHTERESTYFVPVEDNIGILNAILNWT